jgi:ABC-type transport system substrate-binding protein
MRQHPIGTGPFKFVDYKPNQYIKLARNPDYWKPGRPYLDGVEYMIREAPADLERRLDDDAPRLIPHGAFSGSAAL